MNTFFIILCAICVFQLRYPDHAIIYAHQERKFTSDKVLINMLYLSLGWLVFHLHIHLKVYDRNFTLNQL